MKSPVHKASDQVSRSGTGRKVSLIFGGALCGYTSFVKFAQALSAAQKTKQGFKITLTVPENRANFLKFCEIVKKMGNGHHPKLFHIVVEEVPQITESIGKEKSVYGWLLNVGRKFGFVVHSVGQRSTEMSKTVLSQSIYKWVGMQPSKADAKRMSDKIEIPLVDIQGLMKLEYYYKSPGLHNVRRSKLYWS